MGKKLDAKRPLLGSPPYKYRNYGGLFIRVYLDRYNKIYRAETAGKSSKLKLKWEATNR
jgi:hypothetical protein